MQIKNRFISWPGAKFRQLEHIFNSVQIDADTICEPFFGTGAFSLQLVDKTDKLFISEQYHLYLWWRYLLKDTDEMISRMSYFREKYADAKTDREVFNKMRSLYNFLSEEDGFYIDTPALLWVLVYQSTNNLARFNKKGGYNQTWGKNRNVPDPNVVFNNEAKATLCKMRSSLASREYDFHNKDLILMDIFSDFKICLHKFESYIYTHECKPFIFLDPPYIIKTEVYKKNDWTIEQERMLFDAMHQYDRHSTPWIMTNYIQTDVQKHPFYQEIYDNWQVIPLPRKLDARPTGTGNYVEEVIICGKGVKTNV